MWAFFSISLPFTKVTAPLGSGGKPCRFKSCQAHHVGAPSARLRKPGYVRAGFSSAVLRGSSFSPSKHASMGPGFLVGSGILSTCPAKNSMR